MAQTKHILDTLKLQLKANGKTYADVAKKLKLTEASVKRLFSEKSFSLDRLDAICEMLGMEISDLVHSMNSLKPGIEQLTEAQEKEIASDMILLLITVCALNRWTLNDITENYNIKETEIIRYLAKLDRLKIIELLPGNRIKLLIAPNFKWIENGPIQNFFQTKVEADFFSSRFDKPSEILCVINGMLSDSSDSVFKNKIEKLTREFNELNDNDASLPVSRRKGTTVVIAVRNWELGLFSHLRKSKR